ncbi:MAG: ADP-heptose--LPS heptosyltransferase [Ignavibacteria bacterium RIFOXYB2_FULL_35_12]|nr:MAG: ADP-heptose--LPS heptosyltransferase [Ignavibacteria bacterium GWA2_36_19]OGU51830.1 MAG: ADP-heptose--LPS heptosyltransferase [Ignavibacteria bacterium GWC2_35_8]OGU56214.1 MAG: ADP-heptose--LPS heptosyltransferase [Ignavibacteria bacterium GWF2_35_20]OGU86726.1 MAG: ADP-heptose--LPS heptosyltransferase [Ignavibacteria bacterium RIFOXYC12_FULL_35_11]OGU89421.1 MAG: ADP-heptose--LPS heptosyltransferase [Ignavibacteria bacterium RIFOXYA12_FULL_35_25]OGU94113.1 MAG: ADP-heptose--LPS hept
MSARKFYSNLIHTILKKFLALNETKIAALANPKNFLIVRQHNQLGDLLAGVSLLRAIKEKYPQSKITLIVSPVNYTGLVKNKFIDDLFIFDKKKLLLPTYFFKLYKILKKQYDVTIVPVTVSISFTSNLLCRLSNSITRIGPRSLDGKQNESAYLFDKLVDIDWRKFLNSNVADRILDIIRPFGIDTNNFHSEISFDDKDAEAADKFLKTLSSDSQDIIIGFHCGAGKKQNRWSLQKYVELIKKLDQEYKAKMYLTGSNSDNEEINYVVEHVPFELGLFLNKSIPEVAALVSKSTLFISNDTGIMHVAGTTNTPQISIFGPTNPLNWAPIGANKFYVRKSDLIDDVEIEDVCLLTTQILK